MFAADVMAAVSAYTSSSVHFSLTMTHPPSARHITIRHNTQACNFSTARPHDSLVLSLRLLTPENEWTATARSETCDASLLRCRHLMPLISWSSTLYPLFREYTVGTECTSQGRARTYMSCRHCTKTCLPSVSSQILTTE